MTEKYQTERITNIEELEAIHRSLFMDASRLRKELEAENPNMLCIADLAKRIHMDAHKAVDFEFYIEQRIVNVVKEE